MERKRNEMVAVMKFMYAPHNVGAYTIISKVFEGNKNLIEHLRNKLDTCAHGRHDFYALFFDLDDEKKLTVINWILENYDGGATHLVDTALNRMNAEEDETRNKRDAFLKVKYAKENK